jgi:hypothetical protein
MPSFFRARDEHDAAAAAQPLLQSLEGRVGPLRDEASESLQPLVVEGGGLAAAVRPGLERAGPAAELEQSGDGRDVDAEPGGDLPAGALVVVDGGEDALSEIIRQGFHRSPPLEDLTSKSCAKQT